MMKKLSITILFILSIITVSAQDAKENEYYTLLFPNQPNKDINIKMFARKKSWGLGQQFYGIIITNLTPHKLKITGSYHANLTCGNQAYATIDITLQPGETKGNNSYIMDASGLTASADSDLCPGNPVYENGKEIGVNRIEKVGYSITKIENVALQNEQNTKTPLNNSNSVENLKTINFTHDTAKSPTIPETVQNNFSQLQSTYNYANNSAGLNAQQLQASKEIGENLGNFVNAMVNIGSSKRERQYERSEQLRAEDRDKADHGDIEAMKALYRSYKYGKFKDYSEAKYWLEKAANAGDCESLHTIAMKYSLGDSDLGYAKDDVKKFEILNKLFNESKRKFDSGDKDTLEYLWDSSLEIAHCYRYGKGITQSIEKFLEWLNVSVDYNNVDAAIELSSHYRFSDKNRGKYLESLERILPVIYALWESAPDLYSNKKSYKFTNHISLFESYSDAYNGKFFTGIGEIDYKSSKEYLEKALSIAKKMQQYNYESKYLKKRVKGIEKELALINKKINKK